MHECETPSSPRERPRVTVAAIAERQGRFLLVRERSPEGALVINQPAGHLEAGESLVEGVIRETLEETGWGFVPRALVGIYQWQRRYGTPSFLRVALCGDVREPDRERVLDEAIEEVVWLSLAEVVQQRGALRSPLVLKGIEDYLAGERYPMAALKLVAGEPAT